MERLAEGIAAVTIRLLNGEVIVSKHCEGNLERRLEAPLPGFLPRPTNAHLAQIKALWHLETEPTFVRKVENWIYRVTTPRLFLRVTDPSHQRSSQIEAELDWMKHLQSQGVRLAAPVESRSGRYVETVTADGRTFFVSAFREAEGESLSDRAGFSFDTIENWGRTLGRLHAATRTYAPSPAIERRPQWKEERNYLHIQRSVKNSDGVIWDRFQELDAWLTRLPKDEAYGLIHADLHHGNFFVGGDGGFTLFDFDDCQYHWFAYDIAVPIYYVRYALERHRLDQTWEQLNDTFWRGYLSANTLSRFWIESIPRFLLYRHFVVLYWSLANLENPTLDVKSKEWLKNAVAHCRKAIASAIA